MRIFTYETKSAIDMDCLSMDGVAFIDVSHTIEKDVDLNEGSPMFQVRGDNVNVVQYFSMPFQNMVYLRYVVCTSHIIYIWSCS